MSSLKKIRVLVVDDSLLFRETIKKHLNEDPRIEVIGTAEDCFDAMDKIKELKPDVLTLDVELPRMSGIEFVKKLIPTNPMPVVVVSSLPMSVLDALDAGAVDFVRKPQSTLGTMDIKAFINELSVKIKIASTAHIIEKRRATSAISNISTLNINHSDTIIAIGASTGGTEAILSVIKDLPATTPGILVVQHMPPVFTKMYAQRLDKLCKMSVKEAEDRDRVEQGRVLIAPGDFHMRLAKDSAGFYVKCQNGEKVSGHCPSVDVLFESVSQNAKNNSIGIILTGMGADGSKGLLQMKQKGAYTIGQDKASSVVYGMPMVSFNIGAVTKQLPLDEISNEIIKHLNKL